MFWILCHVFRNESENPTDRLCIACVLNVWIINIEWLLITTKEREAAEPKMQIDLFCISPSLHFHCCAMHLVAAGLKCDKCLSLLSILQLIIKPWNKGILRIFCRKTRCLFFNSFQLKQNWFDSETYWMLRNLVKPSLKKVEPLFFCL